MILTILSLSSESHSSACATWVPLIDGMVLALLCLLVRVKCLPNVPTSMNGRFRHSLLDGKQYLSTSNHTLHEDYGFYTAGQ